jgi:polysaccharide pyruvyl transferase WcaK-like protein
VEPRADPFILVTDGWLVNTGDAASYLATTASLKRAIPGARVAISTHHRKLVGSLYPDLELAPPLDALAGVRWPWTSDVDIADRGLAEELVDRADLILAAGGGYLLERYGPEGRIRVYEELLARGKRLMFYSQSIGTFQDPELGERLRAVLRSAELVLVRDEVSQSIVTAQRDADGVVLTADEAFLFEPPRRLVRPHTLLATVSMHPWDRSGDSNELDEGSYLRAIGAAFGRLLAAGEVTRLTFASTGQGFGGPELAIEDDSLAAREVIAGIPAHLHHRVQLISRYLRPDDYALLAMGSSAVVSMRMHGAILASVSGSPVLLANASDKARALSARTDGGIKGIAHRDDLGRLDEEVLPLLRDRRGSLVRQDAAVQKMQNLAAMNASLVAEKL